MKILTSFLIITFLISSLCYGEIVYKQGYIHTLLDTAGDSTYQEVEWSKRANNISYGVSLGYFQSVLRGQEVFWVEDKGTEGEWKDAGTLHTIPLMLNFKYHFKNLYIGCDAGIGFMNFSENYDGQAQVNNRKMFQGIIGYKLNDRLSIEVKRLFSDLSIESGSKYIGVMENRSNLNSWVVCGSWRF